MDKPNNCRKCSIILTEENKVKKEYICKSCNKIKHNEWRLRKANNEVPISKPKASNCSSCSIELEVEQHYNKVKQFATEHNIELKEFNYNQYF
jgi:hypothetical protein